MIYTKSYSEMIELPTFKERLEYLRIKGSVGFETFGSHRYLNQRLYQSYEWTSTRRKIILRDGGFDLADPDRSIVGRAMIHHINPITIDDILQQKKCVFDPENLVLVSHNTHQMIHYGSEEIIFENFADRKPNDTCPWR